MKSLVTKFKYFVELSRPLNLFQAALAILVGYWLTQPGSVVKLGYTLLTVLTFTAGGNAINDYFDAEIDKINKPKRIIPAGKISKNEALAFAIIIFLVGLGALIPIWNHYTGVIGFISLILLILYTPLLKNTIVLGNLVVSIILGVTFIFATAAFGEPLAGLVPALLAFGFNLVREIIKDMEDVVGDRSQNIRTLATKYGKEKAKYFALLGIILIFIGIPLPFFLDIYNQYYLWVVLALVEIPLIYSFVSLLKDISKSNCAKLSSILKYDIFIGLLAIFLGKI